MRWAAVLCVSTVFLTLGLAQWKTTPRTRSAPAEYAKAYQSREDKGNFSRAVLHNGLTVVIEEVALHPLAAVVAYANARSPLNLSGALASGEIGRKIRNLGGILELQTNADFTALSTIAPAENVIKILELQASAFSNPHPGHMILAISGAVRREQVLEKVAELHASMPVRGRTNEYVPAVSGSPPLSFRYEHVRTDIQEPNIVFSYRVPGLTHEDYYPLLLLSYALGKGQGSLLHRSLVEGTDALHAECRFEAHRGGGTFVIEMRVPTLKIDRAEVRVLAQLEVLKRHGLSQNDLIRATALLLKDYYASLELLEERALALARHEDMGRYLDRDQVAQLIQRLSSQQVHRSLERYFTESNLSLVEYFPKDAEPRRFTAESFLETMRLLLAENLPKQEEEHAAHQTNGDVANPAPLKFAPSYFKHELRKTSVLRGPEIYFKEEHLVPIVHLGIFFPGGRINESSTNAGITELTLRTLIRNTPTRKSELLWKYLESLGADLRVVNEPDFFGVQAALLSPSLEEVLQVLIEWIRKPVLVEEELNLERAKLLSLIRRETENSFESLLNQARVSLYGAHPYGLSRYGTEESVSKLTQEAVQNWIKSQISEIHPLIIIRGDIEGTAFLERFVSALSDAGNQYREPVKKEGAQSAHKAIRSPEAVMLVFSGPARGTRNDLVLDVIENLISGIQIFHESGVNGGAVFAYVSGPQDPDAAAQRLREELDRLKTGPLRNEEFLSALVATIARFHIQSQRGRDYVLELTRNILAGEGADYEKAYLATIKDINREDIASVAKQYFIN